MKQAFTAAAVIGFASATKCACEATTTTVLAQTGCSATCNSNSPNLLLAQTSPKQTLGKCEKAARKDNSKCVDKTNAGQHSGLSKKGKERSSAIDSASSQGAACLHEVARELKKCKALVENEEARLAHKAALAKQAAAAHDAEVARKAKAAAAAKKAADAAALEKAKKEQAARDAKKKAASAAAAAAAKAKQAKIEAAKKAAARAAAIAKWREENKEILANKAAIASKEAAEHELSDAIAALKKAIADNIKSVKNVAAARKRVAKARADLASATKHQKHTELMVPHGATLTMHPDQKAKLHKDSSDSEDMDSVIKANDKKPTHHKSKSVIKTALNAHVDDKKPTHKSKSVFKTALNAHVVHHTKKHAHHSKHSNTANLDKITKSHHAVPIHHAKSDQKNCKSVAATGMRTCRNQANAVASKEKYQSANWTRAHKIGKECAVSVDAALKKCLNPNPNSASYMTMGFATVAAAAMLF